MNDDERIELQAIERAKSLLSKRKEILSLGAEEAINRILDERHPAAVVHSFPEEDFYFLIHDIGIEDSEELLSLASNRQWNYIIDLEIWNRDRIEIKALTRWFYHLLKADPDRFIRWFLEENTEIVSLYLFNTVDVIVREHDQDPSDFSDNFFTFDGVFYLRFKDNPYESGNPEYDAQRYEVLSEFFERLAAYDHIIYQDVILEFQCVIPAEIEEELYRRRNFRLAEKGFMPVEEAIGIYQPIKPESVMNKSTKRIVKNIRSLPPVPLYPTSMMDKSNLFVYSLQSIEIDEVLQQVQMEFANLCNQVIVADQKPVKERNELKNVVKKVCGYLSMGIERIVEGKNNNPSQIAALMQRVPLSRIFRVGYGMALELKWRAEKWHRQSWFQSEGLPLAFWGEKWLGVLGGLLLKRPLFFDNYKTGVLFREFASVYDLKYSNDILNMIIAFDDLLSRMRLPTKPETKPIALGLTHKSLVLTHWARHCLGLPEKLSAIPLDLFRQFFATLWSDNKASRRDTFISFLNWISDKAGMDKAEIILNYGKIFEDMFDEIQDEYGSVSEEHLDPRHIYLFLVKSIDLRFKI